MVSSKDCKDEQRAILCRIGADREEEDCKDEKGAILHRIALCRIGANWPDGDARMARMIKCSQSAGGGCQEG